MKFEEYLISKRIDSKLFRQKEKELWEEWEMFFELLHPNSFTSQWLFKINAIRRKYTLVEVQAVVKEPHVKVKSIVKPKIS